MITYHQNAVRVTEKQLAKLDLAQWICEEKFKGIRCWYIKEGAGNIRLVTRGLEDITANFPHLTEYEHVLNIDRVQLDCELYDPSQQDEVVSGWAMTISLDPEICKDCVLKVFDIVHGEDVDLTDSPQITRKAILECLKLSGPLQMVEYFPGEAHRDFYEYILSKGGEGVMLKNRLATYAEGRRQVGRWLKRKKRDMFDVVITGFTPGKGKFEGLIGSIEVSQYVSGALRYICCVSGISDDLRKDMTFNKEKYLGKVISVRAMEQDAHSLALIEPAFSHIRVDKLPEDCIPSVSV